MAQGSRDGAGEQGWRREQGWRSGESARLPPMWPGFDSRTRRHMWVEFVVGSRPCSERFFSGYSGFPLSSKTNISKFKFDLDTVEEEPLSGSTANPYLLFLFYFILYGTLIDAQGLLY